MAYGFSLTGNKKEITQPKKSGYGFSLKKQTPVVKPVVQNIPAKQETPFFGQGLRPVQSNVPLPFIQKAVAQGNIPKFDATSMVTPKAPTLGDTAKSVGRGIANVFTSSSQAFGRTLGTAASVVSPTLNKERNATLASNNAQIDNYLNLANKEINPAKKQTYLKAAQKLQGDNAPTDVFTGQEYQKNAKQITGEAVGTITEALIGSFAGKAVAGQGLKQGAKAIAKDALINITAPSVAYGVASGMQANKDLGGIAKEGVVSGLVGTGLGLGLQKVGGAIANKLGKSIETKNIKSVITKKDFSDVESVRKSIAYNTKLKPEVSARIKSKNIGIDELPYNKDGNITLYREGKVVPGKTQSYSLTKKWAEQKPIVVNKSDIVLNTTSSQMDDIYSKTYKGVELTENKRALDSYRKLEGEVLSTTPKIKPQEVAGEALTTKTSKLPSTQKDVTTGQIKANKSIKYIPEEKAPDLRKKITVESTLGQPSVTKRIEKQTVEKGLTEAFKDIPDYDKVNMKDQAARVSNLIDNDPEKAVRIALGKELPTDGSLPESVLIGVKNKALADGDTDLLVRLATEEGGVARESTVLGQRIKMLDEGLENDPLRNIAKVVKDRRNAIEAKTGKKVKDLINNEVKNIKNEVAKVKPTKGEWAMFIDEIRCPK